MGQKESFSINNSSRNDLIPYVNLIENQKKKNFCFPNIENLKKNESSLICMEYERCFDFFKYNVK